MMYELEVEPSLEPDTGILLYGTRIWMQIPCVWIRPMLILGEELYDLSKAVGLQDINSNKKKILKIFSNMWVCVYIKKCFFLTIFGPGGLHAPCVRHACAMRSLAIVITIVQSFSLSPPSFAFDPLRGISRV